MTNAEKFLEEFGNIDDEFIEEAMNYTMKKKFNFKPIIAIAACAALALAAVPVVNHFVNTPGVENPDNGKIGASGKFNVLYAGGVTDGNQEEYSDELVASLKEEGNFSGIDEKFIDKSKVDTNKTITIAGVNFTGVYVDSSKSDYYCNDKDNYFLEKDNKKITFSINRETGICTKFFIADESLSTSAEKKFTRDECYEKAIVHIKEYVDDIENYELTGEREYGGRLGYLFSLCRKVNGIKTSDAINIAVNYMGDVYAHVLYSIGEMKDIDISAINMQKVEDAVDAKIKIAYENYSDVKHNNESVLLVKRADGKYILIYRESVDITDTVKNAKYRNHIKIIVEIE